MGLEAMTKTEMLEILRGKVLRESPEEIQARLNEIADELERSERAVHGRWVSLPHKAARVCSRCEHDEPYKCAENDADVYNYCPNCGARMDEVSE